MNSPDVIFTNQQDVKCENVLASCVDREKPKNVKTKYMYKCCIYIYRPKNA